MRRSVSDPSLRLVLLHGYGSDERDMVGLARELPAEIDVVCFRAPGEMENGGYAWFDLSIDEFGFGFDDEGFNYAVALVLQSLPPEDDVPLALGGFSQGAMVAAAVTLVDPRVRAAWLMSGAFPPVIEMPPSPARPVLVQHGLSDAVLPIAMGRDLARRLEETGLEVVSREYPMGHSVSDESLTDGVAWLTSLYDEGV